MTDRLPFKEALEQGVSSIVGVRVTLDKVEGTRSNDRYISPPMIENRGVFALTVKTWQVRAQIIPVKYPDGTDKGLYAALSIHYEHHNGGSNGYDLNIGLHLAEERIFGGDAWAWEQTMPKHRAV